MSDARMKIGFIGAGNMGRPMIRHLTGAGHAVKVFVRRKEMLSQIEALGAVGVESLAAAALQADVVLLNVTATEDVEDVLFGKDGAAAAMVPGCICIDFSTISPAASVRFADRLRAGGISFLDAPVSGGVKGAEAATLSIMVGGEAEALTKAMPLLRLLGGKITHIGPSGAGQVAKACNQIIQVINIQGIAEAMLYAARMGADPGRVIDAISAGMAGSRMLDLMGPKMAARDFQAGIEARLHAKDIAMVAAAAQELGMDMPATAVADRQLERLLALGWGREDTSSLLRVLEAHASGGPNLAA
ncbi:2-hydroxy-3-oxopropionate reductase [Anaerolineales bacterium]|nr:2-hydroxy-3-oxopropionate reductase [Anaerolineales bacterium]